MKIISIYSSKPSIEEAVADLKNQFVEKFDNKPARLVIFFASSNYDPSEISAKVKESFGGVDVFGCTTAGELVSGRVLKNSVVAMVFDDEAITDSVIGVVENIKENDNIKETFEKFKDHYGDLSELDMRRHVGVILIDGMSGAEEKVMDEIGNLSDLTFIGGSAGDDLKFKETHVFYNGKTYTDAAIIALLRIENGFDILKTQSFCEFGKVLEATKVDEEDRIIEEFDGRPAVEAYAGALGIEEERAEDEFMSHPVGLMIDGEPYVRSPQQIIDDRMKFYCNVKKGAKLSILDSTDIVEETKKRLNEKLEKMGGASAVINFHCILRTKELEKKNQTDAYGKVFSDISMIGFSTYGEQYIGHVNQTSTMLVFK